MASIVLGASWKVRKLQLKGKTSMLLKLLSKAF